MNAPVKVKPLEWYEPTDHPMDMDGSSQLVAAGLGGRYHISHAQTVGPTYLLWWAHDEFIWTGHDTIDAAKEVAAEDYAARILSAIEVSE